MKTAGTKRIAERYVKALFDVAQSASSTETVEKDMATIGQTLDISPELRSFLENPLLAPEARAGAMLAVLDKLKTGALTRQFIGMVLKQKRLALLPQIIVEFARVASEARGEITADVTTAAPLNDKQAQALAQRLGKAYGRTVRVNASHDASLLGGMIVRVGSQQLDSSLSGKLRRMGQALRAA